MRCLFDGVSPTDRVPRILDIKFSGTTVNIDINDGKQRRVFITITKHDFVRAGRENDYWAQDVNNRDKYITISTLKKMLYIYNVDSNDRPKDGGWQIDLEGEQYDLFVRLVRSMSL